MTVSRPAVLLLLQSVVAAPRIEWIASPPIRRIRQIATCTQRTLGCCHGDATSAYPTPLGYPVANSTATDPSFAWKDQHRPAAPRQRGQTYLLTATGPEKHHVEPRRDRHP